MSVVVPHYGDPTALAACLDALERQTLPRQRFEIIVVDNASPEADLVAAVIGDRARLITVAERGAGPARNGGLEVATATLLAFTDSDCVPAPGWLAAGLEALAGSDLVGGRMAVSDPAAVGSPRTGAQAFELIFAFDNRAYVADKGFTVTANLFSRRDVFAAVGGFAAATAEDIEWCHRATAAGFRLGYCDDALVEHPPRSDWAALVTKTRRQNAERFALQRVAPRGRLRWLAQTWLLPASILAHAPRVLRHQVVRSAHDRRAALATLARIRLWRFADAHRLLTAGR